MSICRLCLEEKKLIGRSQIIPDFLYKHGGLYDDKHKINHFSIQDLVDGKKPSLLQSGVHEGNLLYPECDDRRLGDQLEQYAKKAIYRGGRLPADQTPDCKNYYNAEGGEFMICSNLNYTKFKLFLLSILWRASISTKSFFNQINLGAHEEIIRQMIFSNDARQYDDYPILLVSTVSDKAFSSDVVLEPYQGIDKDGMPTCMFIISGFIYIYKIGSFQGKLPELRHQTINEDNKAMIMKLPTGKPMKLIKKYVGLDKI